MAASLSLPRSSCFVPLLLSLSLLTLWPSCSLASVALGGLCCARLKAWSLGQLVVRLFVDEDEEGQADLFVEVVDPGARVPMATVWRPLEWKVGDGIGIC
jgi:hypothetical protein